ncbi:hypothetical protein SAMN05444158_3439 [Bradyrhizobium canariense]|uniref:Uncharacterized protein n=1 Tax=Bradyrhizobium canariense TaxID=255045 RepID=A0A1H1VJE4_9BRAD|nr:hypothetical protein SAMN05444158_3439 [Bradyrhizobium canariense]
MERGRYHLSAGSLAIELDNQTVAAPKLNVMPINQAFSLGNGFPVVETNQWLVTYKMPVDPDRVDSILSHPTPRR